MEQEPIKLDLPDADLFLRNLENCINKVNDKCLEIISGRLGITKEEAKELAEGMQDEAMNEYIKEQMSKEYVLLKWNSIIKNVKP